MLRARGLLLHFTDLWRTGNESIIIPKSFQCYLFNAEKDLVPGGVKRSLDFIMVQVCVRACAPHKANLLAVPRLISGRRRDSMTLSGHKMLSDRVEATYSRKWVAESFQICEYFL